MSAFVLAVLLAGALAEKFAKQESVHRLDWIMLSATAAIAAILLGLVMANRSRPDAVGEGEITVFDLGLDDSMGAAERNKPLKSIGTLAESIRQTAGEISMITDRLADAHASATTSEKTQGSTMRSIVDSEADTLAQLDVASAEAAMVAAETAALNELIGAGLTLAEMHTGQSANHAQALESTAEISNRAIIKAGEAALQVRAVERDRDALLLIGHEALTSLRQMLHAVDESLLAFGDAAKNLDGANASSETRVPQNPSEFKFCGTDTIRELTSNLSKTADCIQLARMNQRLHAGSAQGTSQTGLEEAEVLIRKTRDVAALLELQVHRDATSGDRIIKDISSHFAALKNGHHELFAKTTKLSKMAGNLGQALGQIRHEMQLEASRLEKFLARSASAGRQLDSVMPELILATSEIAHNNTRLAIESQRLHIDGIKLLGKLDDIRITSTATHEQLQRLQQATGATTAKVEAVVKQVHALALSENIATRRSTANAARFSIHDKLAHIDRFALRVIEMESKVKRMRGPSPAIDRSEMEKLPDYEFPVH